MPPYTQRLRELVAAKHLGRKSGQGFYTWQDGTVAPITATRAVNQNFDFITGAQ